MTVTKIVRKVGEFGWSEYHKQSKAEEVWHKIIFEVEVENQDVRLDPIEHQDYVWATEDEVAKDKAGEVALTWITQPNKDVNLEAFRLRRGAQAFPSAA